MATKKDDPAPDPHPVHPPPLDPTAPPPPGSAPMIPPETPQPPPPSGTPPSGSAPGVPPPGMGPVTETQPEQHDTEPPPPLPPPAPPQVPPPTDAQYAWFAAHPGYVRISHGLGSYTNRGTLTADGTYIPEGPGFPVVDSDSSFGVGTIPF